MIDLQITPPLDYRDLSFDTLLANLQGNILKGHGRDNTVHLFLRFKVGSEAAVKEWIAKFSAHITSCKEQLRQRELFKRNGVSGGLFAGIYFASSFYRYLGLEEGEFGDQPFRDGMKSRQDILHDLPVEEWEEDYKEQIHAMVLLGHDDPVELGQASAEICNGLHLGDEKVPLADVVTIEYGSVIRNANGDGLEHFGYVDGISQPLFLMDDVEEYKKRNILPLRFDPTAELDLVLVKDPFSQEEDAFGSYFVFRKLEQNIRKFKEEEKALAERLKLEGEDEERAGAMIIGRFEDGTPVTLSNTEGMISSGILNNFNYKENVGGQTDDEGARCPFHAHIRKSNPRRSDADKTHIMARRGITYGHRNVSTTVEQEFVQMPKDGVGLLFMSFQKSIANQFEHIQTNWVNQRGFPEGKKTGLDLIIGQGTTDRNGWYMTEYNKVASLEQTSFGNFIKLRGGEYFFAPSIPFLKNISSQFTND